MDGVRKFNNWKDTIPDKAPDIYASHCKDNGRPVVERVNGTDDFTFLPTATADLTFDDLRSELTDAIDKMNAYLEEADTKHWTGYCHASDILEVKSEMKLWICDLDSFQNKAEDSADDGERGFGDPAFSVNSRY